MARQVEYPAPRLEDVAVMEARKPGAGRPATLCELAKDLYEETTDEGTKLRLRYMVALAKVVTKELEHERPGWLRGLYLTRAELTDPIGRWRQLEERHEARAIQEGRQPKRPCACVGDKV